MILEPKLLAVRHSVRARKLAYTFESLVVLHPSSSSFNWAAALRLPCAFAEARCAQPTLRRDRASPGNPSVLRRVQPTAHRRAAAPCSPPARARAGQG